jgi:DNA-3-methyladenine glycosylase I
MTREVASGPEGRTGDANGSSGNGDDLVRCPWVGIADPVYVAYHDDEWGVPVTDDRRLLEKLALEGFQAGLSWLTILKKRENFRRAFAGFDPEQVARWGPPEVARLMGDTGIVRNRAKIEATIDNARAYLALRERRSLAALIWEALPDGPLVHERRTLSEVPAETAQSRAISKALKAHGFRFVGPTTVYAFMQSTGMVNDHLVSCHRHAPCKVAQMGWQRPPR